MSTESPLGGTMQSTSKDDAPISKLAERVKLRKMGSAERRVTAADLNGMEVCLCNCYKIIHVKIFCFSLGVLRLQSN